MSYGRQIISELGQSTDIDFALLYPNNKVKSTSSIPSFITNSTDLNGFITFWTSVPIILGSFTVTINVWSSDGLTYVGKGVITVLVQDIFENIDNCCSDNNINIVWLNRQGGYSNFIFSERQDFNVDIGKKNTYISSDIIKYASIKGVYNGKIVYSTGLSKTAIDFIDTLKYSIQAWIFNSDHTFTPILVDVKSFTKYNTNEEMYTISLPFIYAKVLNIQKQ